MPVALGTCMGSYEVVAAIGAGGMGEVYRARDTRLNRDVALKILPAAFASDPERLARFEREAQVLASLNHPHIAGIYGIEESNGVRALVLEFVDGETLADRIARGPIPIDDALPVARQIAEALEAAHDRGIIHRDLKPANIKLRGDGTVKVLDFGLAKLAAPAATPTSTIGSLSPTITSPALVTGVGVLLGTAAYMSPEQARGREADTRSDIWAFGCVLYEMLTGKRAFDGDEVADTLANILKAEPDWHRLPASTPVALRRLLVRCLHKDRRERLRHIGDAILEIGPGYDLDTPVPAPQHSRRRVLIAGFAGLTLGAVLAVSALWWLVRSAPVVVSRVAIPATGVNALHLNGSDRDLAITPDGSRVVYVGNNGTQLFVRRLDEFEPRALTTAGAPRGPFISPDGEWVGFFDGVTGITANVILKRVPVSGGQAVTICRVDGAPRGATWRPDGSIVFATNAVNTGLQQVAAAGGVPTRLTTPDHAHGEADHFWPQSLPDSSALLFTVIRTAPGAARSSSDLVDLFGATTEIFDIATGSRKLVLSNATDARYVSSGHLLFGREDGVHASAFDRKRLRVTGDSYAVLPRVATTRPGAVDFDVSANGTLVYVAGGALVMSHTLAWVDRQGHEQPITVPTRAYQYPRISPDGQKVVVDAFDEQMDLWMWDIARSTLTRATFGPGRETYPVWMPDGHRVVFAWERGGPRSLFWQLADGAAAVEQLTMAGDTQYGNSVSPDGRQLVFRQDSQDTGSDLHVLELAGERKQRPLIATRYNEMNAEISPDGRWLAYQSDESGAREVYVRPFPDVERGRWQITTAGGTRPAWSPAGHELFYLAADGAMMQVPVEAGATWTNGTATKLFNGPYFYGQASGAAGRTYDVARDGHRFLMVKIATVTADSAANILVVQNWTEELKRTIAR